MLVTVNCLLTASPSPQSHLASLLQAINTSTPGQSDLTLFTGDYSASVSLQPSILCLLSPLLSSLFSSSSSPFAILIPSASPYSLALARQLLYTGQCLGTLAQLEDAAQLVHLLGVDIQNEVVEWVDAVRPIPEDIFFLACESTSNVAANEEVVNSALSEVALDSSTIVVILDEHDRQDEFASKFVSAEEVSNTVSLSNIEIESLPTGSHTEGVSSTSEFKCKKRTFPCNQCDYIASQKGNLKRHNQARHGGLKSIEQVHETELKKKETVKTVSERKVLNALTLNMGQKESDSSSRNSDILLSDEEVEDDFENVAEEGVDKAQENKETKKKIDVLNINKLGDDLLSNSENSDVLLSDEENEKLRENHDNLDGGVFNTSGRKSEDIYSQGCYPCNQCHYIAKQNGHLKRHVLAKHSLVRFECKLCVNSFSSKDVLYRHVQSLHKNQTYPCPQCKFVATRSETLKYHVQWKHSGGKVSCDECDYQAATIRLIKRHRLRTHAGVRYTCNKCEYQADEKSTLFYHMKSEHKKV
eukprot:GFUD01025769.1.p1 GENE.GFUD01025769.1~~GFUD01025769.1.p1  ORF type:complete len:529 (+),score=122.84 GFUD01025769.1:66-1652(+)